MVTLKIAKSILRFRKQRTSSKIPQIGCSVVVAVLCDSSFGGQH